jgi:DNA-directed RNA polymerase subunit RPC12/RpoP
MKFPCLHCERKLSIPDEQLEERVGRSFACPNCSDVIFVHPAADGEGIELSTVDYVEGSAPASRFEVVEPGQDDHAKAAPAKRVSPIVPAIGLTSEGTKPTIVLKASPTVSKKGDNAAPPKPQIVSKPSGAPAPRIVSKSAGTVTPKVVKADPQAIKARIVTAPAAEPEETSSTARKLKNAGMEIPSPKTGRQAVSTSKKPSVKTATIKKRNAGSRKISASKSSGKRSRRSKEEEPEEESSGKRGRKGKGKKGKDKSNNKVLIIVLVVLGLILVGGGITIAVIANKPKPAPPAPAAPAPMPGPEAQVVPPEEAAPESAGTETPAETLNF